MRAEKRRDLAESISRMLDGELGPHEQQELRARLDRDPGARQVYDELARAEAALDSDPESFEKVIAARVGARILERSVPAPAPRPWRWPRWLVGSLATSAALFLLAPSLDTETFQSRGEESTQVPLDGDHGFRVIRVRVGPDGRPDIADGRSLRAGDTLRFAVFSRQRSARISLLQVQPNGRRRVLIERAPIEPAERMRRLDVALDVDADDVGLTRFVAVFEHDETHDLMSVPLSARDEGGTSVRLVAVEVTK